MATPEDADDMRRVDVLRGNLLNVVTLSGEPPDIVQTALLTAAMVRLRSLAQESGTPLTEEEAWNTLGALCLGLEHD